MHFKEESSQESKRVKLEWQAVGLPFFVVVVLIEI